MYEKIILEVNVLPSLQHILLHARWGECGSPSTIGQQDCFASSLRSTRILWFLQPYTALSSKTPSCSPNLFGDLEPQHDLQISVLFCRTLKTRNGTNLLPPRTVFSDMSMSLDPQSATKTGSLIRLGRSQLCLWKCGSENKWAKTVNRNKDCTYPEITNEVAGHRAILPNRIPITSTCSQNRTHQPVNPDLEAQGMSLAKLFSTCDMLAIIPERMPGAPRSSKDPSAGMMLLILLRPFSIVFKRYGSSMNEGSSNQKCSHSNQSLTAKIRLKAMSSSSCLVQLRSTFDITFKGRRKHLFSWAPVPGQRHFWWDGKGLARFGILE